MLKQKSDLTDRPLTNEEIADPVGRVWIGKANGVTLKNVAIDIFIVFELANEIVPVDCFNHCPVPQVSVIAVWPPFDLDLVALVIVDWMIANGRIFELGSRNRRPLMGAI